MSDRQKALRWESRWAVPVAVVTFVAVALLFASTVLNKVSGSHEGEILRSIHEHSGSVVFTGILQAIGFALLVAPLVYLFRAVQARSPQVRGGLIGLAVAAPLFLAVSGGISVGARTEAASQFAHGEAKSTLSPKEANEKCVEQRSEHGAKKFVEEVEAPKGQTPLAACERQRTEDNEAENAIRETSLTAISSGLGIAGGLGFTVILFYTGLWAMRTGLLTRFWGSLGMGAGIAFLLGPLFILSLVWMLYFGLLLLGVVPGGRPPAWETGEAVPWPTPGERAAATLEGERAAGDEAGEGAGLADDEEPAGGATGDGEEPSGPPRKRKQRS